MTRFLSREEWPLVAAGIAAGIVTSVVVIWFFLTNLGGGAQPAGTLVTPGSDTATAVAEEIESGERPGTGSTPLIGGREDRVRARLAAMPVDARPLRGALLITARDIAWNEEDGARFTRAERITGELQLAGIGRGDVVIEDVVVTRPVVAMREERSGWNYEQVFEELLEGDPAPGPKRLIQLRNVRVENGEVTVVRPAQRLVLRRVEARMPLIVMSQQGVAAPYLTTSRVTMEIEGLGEPADTRFALDVGAGRFAFPDGTVRFDVDEAAVDRTRFADLSGVWDPTDPGFGVTATGLAPEVLVEDVRFLLPPSFPETGTASFAWDIRPLAPDGTEVSLTNLDARSGDSRITGAVAMQIAPENVRILSADLRADPVSLSLVEGFTGPLPYGGSVTGTIRGAGGDITFDLLATLTTPAVPEPFRANIAGNVLMAADGFTLRRADIDLARVPLAALRAMAPGLPLSGLVTGRVSLTGLPGEAPLNLDMRLEMGTGVALLQGMLDMTGTVPRYDFDGQVIGVDLAEILEPEVPPVTVTAGFSFAGSGFEPAVMDARLRVAGGFTGWQSSARDTLFASARIASGSVQVDTLITRLATLDAAASGTWRFLEPQSGAVRYAVDVSSLRPWGPYIPAIGDSLSQGSLVASGTVSGTLARMQLTGVAAGRDLVVGPYAAASLDADYDLTLGGGGLPSAIVNARATDVAAATAGTYTEAVLALQLTPPGLTYRFDAERTDGGEVEVAGTGSLPEGGERRVVVETARFDLVEERWALQQPAVFRWTGGGPVWVDGLEIRAEDGAGVVALDGRVLPLAQMDARVTLAEFPVGDVQRLLGQPALLEGTLWVDGTVRGGAETTLVDVTFEVREGAISGVPLQSAGGSLRYRDNVATLDAQVLVDSAGRLDVDVALPSFLRIGAQPVFELLDGQPLSGSIVAEQFALAPLAALVPEVRDVTGTADARVTLAGTADQPVVDGILSLANGSVRVPQLDQEFTEISGTVAFDGRELTVQDLRARADGWATVGGRVVLERLDEPVLDLDITFDGFQPLGVPDQNDASVFGTVAIDGPPEAMVVTGSVLVENGDVVIPEFTAGLDQELVDMTRPPARSDEERLAAERSNWFRNLAVRDLAVEVGDGVWFQAVDARVQLAGNLVVNKQGDTTPIVGTLEGNRGQYTLVAGPLVRRFEIVAAQIRFTGNPEPSPTVDITARRIVLDQTDRQLNVDVRLTGTLDNLALSLAGGEGVAASEAELLNFLVFGQAGAAIGGGSLPGDELIEQTFFGGLWEVAALELERSLSGLGLDVFQIRFGSGAFGGLGAPTFLFGRQLRRNVFLTVETGVNALLSDGGGNDQLNTLAVRLDWNFDPRSRLRLAWEPVNRGRFLRSSGLALPAFTGPQQQFLIEVRRRWTY